MSIIKEVKQEEIMTIKNSLLDESLQNKEVSIRLKNDSIQGVVRDISEDFIMLSKNGNWNDKIQINSKDIMNLKSSEYPYFSMEHKRNLREKKIPRFSFRYSQDELNDLKNKYVFVNYDGKIINGKVVRVIHRTNQPSSIIIESMNKKEMKEIEDYRLRELDVVSDSLQEFEGVQFLKDLEVRLHLQLESEYSKGCADALSQKEVDPDSLLEQYYESKLNELKGLQVDFNGLEYLWTQEVFEKYKKSEKTNGFRAKLNEDLKKARDVNEYYNSKKEFINFVIKTIKEIDWTIYSKSQREGEIEAFEYLYESGVI